MNGVCKNILEGVVSAGILMGTVFAFDVKPIIIPLNRDVKITVRATNPAEKKAIADLPLHYLSDQGRWQGGKTRGPGSPPPWQELKVDRGDGVLTFTVNVSDEGGHTLRFGAPYSKGVLEFMIYSLRGDLFGMRPYKGDIHQHSVRCGHAKTEPHLVPAYNRRAGFDFMCLSEHRVLEPTFEAINAAKPWKSGLVMFPGEEFQTPCYTLHSVALGHHTGISGYPKAKPEEFKRRVEAMLKKWLPVFKKYGMTQGEMEATARALVIYRVAREHGAKLVIYSHPNAMERNRNSYSAPPRFRQFMLEHADYDALELPNFDTGDPEFAYYRNTDVYMHMNALWVETCHKRKWLIPVVGATDCHNQAASWWLGSVVTVFFAPRCTLDEFVRAVKELRSISEQNIRTTHYVSFGPSRLIQFEQFLAKYYWPEHDRLCKKQGELLLKRAAGDMSVQPQIEKLADEIDAYRESCYAPVK